MQNSPDVEIQFCTELSLWVKPRYKSLIIGLLSGGIAMWLASGFEAEIKYLINVGIVYVTR